MMKHSTPIWFHCPKEPTFCNPGKPSIHLRISCRPPALIPWVAFKHSTQWHSTEMGSLLPWQSIQGRLTPHSPFLRKQTFSAVSPLCPIMLLPLRNEHLGIQYIFKKMDQRDYARKHKAHRGMGQIMNFRKHWSLYINHTNKLQMREVQIHVPPMYTLL